MIDEIEIRADATTEQLGSWLTQQVLDRLGTRAYLLRAIAWARRGAYAKARADVDTALAKQPAHELVELVAALLAYVTRDYDRSLALLDKVAANHKALAAQTLRVLEARAARLAWIAEQRAAHEQLAALGVRDLRAHVHELQRACARVDPRVPEQAARRLWTLHEHLPEQLAAELDAILVRAPTASWVRVLRARLHLRLGQLQQAAAELIHARIEDALAERWALWLARGRARELAEAALPERPSVRLRLLQAEALLECGELERAAERVSEATVSSPRGSAGAELLRVVIEARVSGRGPTRERFAEVYALAPGLLSDAARELGLALWIDGGLGEDSEQLLRCCERARQLLTADRGARLWYRTRAADGALRLRCGCDPNERAAAHEHDGKDLEQASALLQRTLSKRPPSGAARRAAAAGVLSDEQIEGFIADGYVHLRDAFSLALAQAVVHDAQQRLREQPERWLRSPIAIEQLRNYDPDDPQTWPTGRVDLLGRRRFAIHEFSPTCARAVTQLLGGAQRVGTRSWADDLIIMFPSDGEHEQIAPSPDWSSWHLDAPRVDTRLDNLSAGLLVFIVFNELEPASGNTWLALDSPAKVARALADSADGLDFCQLDTAPSITRTCARFFELTGAAGDIYLVHPLMLHSASVNPSPRVRWLGNPMIYVAGVLDHRRPNASPVELSIARALAG
ncbi:MAG TPA: phytanoyl-CoA dioxygenase family protein [Enhygromyxa sp.]|nr:phytanoyl-CoA dioxygenase family protein [Enhygromyxa sp.]